MKKIIPLCLTALIAPNLHGAVLNLYSSAADFAGISQVETGVDPAGGAYTVENFDGSATIGNGDALRVADYSGAAAGTAADDKPEAWWDLTTTIPGGASFRIDYNAANLNLDAADKDINLRFGNSNTGRPTSSARTWTTVSHEQDGSLKIDGSTQADFGAGPLFISFVVNTHATLGFTYTLNGLTQTLAPLSSDTWVDGILEDQDNPMNIGGDIVQADGINELGFTGSSDADENMDFLFDDIVLFTGADISEVPEPSSSLLALLGGMIVLRRRRA
ncbi:MAG: PEP-CTERM sorting domain-containing protein [Akkermansiaceae bacterium]